MPPAIREILPLAIARRPVVLPRCGRPVLD